MIDKIPIWNTTDRALWLVGFNAQERAEILASCARMAAVDKSVDMTALVGWLVSAGAIATLSVLAGRRRMK